MEYSPIPGLYRIYEYVTMGMFDPDDCDWPVLARDRLTVGEIWDKERLEREAEEARMLENTKADAKAVWLLAEYYLPQDIKETAERWKMAEILPEIWRQAFIEGWRAAYRKANIS